MADRLLDRKELAAKLGVTVEWTYRHLARQAGFPAAPLPNRWSESAVDAWIARRSGVPGTEGEQGSPAPDWDAELDRRAAALAGP